MERNACLKAARALDVKIFLPPTGSRQCGKKKERRKEIEADALSFML